MEREDESGGEIVDESREGGDGERQAHDSHEADEPCRSQVNSTQRSQYGLCDGMKMKCYGQLSAPIRTKQAEAKQSRKRRRPSWCVSWVVCRVAE